MTTHLIGCASGIAGADIHSGDGPTVIKQSPHLLSLEKSGAIKWQKMLSSQKTNTRKDQQVAELCTQLANEVANLLNSNNKFCVVGGDHSCAIGTWSGVQQRTKQQGELGLIWIDAHMDSHTPETTPSGNIHGMPLASLMGYGYSSLTSVLNDAAKLKPENVCLIGVRSYESGEAELLKRLNVKVYFMEEVKERGLMAVLDEAVAHVSKHTTAFGVSLDLDALDPEEVPGVDVPEPDGIKVADMLTALKAIIHNEKLIGVEVVEFDPTRDREQMTEKVLADVLAIIATK